MDKIYNTLTLNSPNDTINKYLTEDSLLFDIECTGLSPKSHAVYLICCGYRKGNTVEFVQFFAENESEEAEVLNAFNDFTKGFSRFISYNGSRFDIPFVMERMKKLGITPSFTQMMHLDLYLTLLKAKAFMELPHFKQKDIEEFLGLYRTDMYDGGQLIKVYLEYEFNPDVNAKKLLLLHNFEDVQGMVKVIEALSYVDLLHDEPCVDSYEIEGNALHISAHTSCTLPVLISKNTKYGLFIFSGNRITGSILLFDGVLKTFLKNYRDYMYIISEDMVVPKAIAATVEKTNMKPATKDTCFIKKEGLYCPIPEKLSFTDDVHLFKKSYEDKLCFIDTNSLDKTILSHFIKYVIRHS